MTRLHSPPNLECMNPLQKILLAIAVVSALIVVTRQAMAYQRAEQDEL